jgi:hypothetical protein
MEEEKEIKRQMARMHSSGDQLMETIVDNYEPEDLERLFETLSVIVEGLPIPQIDKDTTRVFFLNGMLSVAEIRQGREASPEGSP